MEVSIWTYIRRGFVYAITSIFALSAGYLIQTERIPERITYDDIKVLLIPLAAAIFFFICYANKFHITDSEAAPSGEKETTLQRQAPVVFLVTAGLFIWAVFGKSLPSYSLLIASGFYSILFISYGIYLLKYVKKREIPLVRHQLVWPAILGIAFSFYYGLNYKYLSDSMLPLLPVLVLLVLFFLSEISKWPRRAFVRRNFIAFFLISIITIVFLIQDSEIGQESARVFSSMLFSLSIAAYLAVFESWKVTAEIAQKTHEDVQNSTGNLIDPVAKALQYVTSSLAFLAGCIWVLPIYFIFSQAGIIFLLAFASHAAVAFVLWFYTGTKSFLLKGRWGTIKLLAGFSFLTLMVFATEGNNAPVQRFTKAPLNIGIISMLFIFGGASITRLILAFRDLFSEDRRSSVFRLFNDRINTARLLCLACWVTCVVIVIAEQFGEELTPASLRAEYSLVVYGAFILICAALEGFEYFGIHKSMMTILSLAGFLQTIRIITSSVIAASVVLPCIFKGMPIFEAIGLSLPFYFASMGGFALNDYFDIAKDRINKPHRAIPSNRLSPDSVLIISVVLIAIAFSTAFLVNRDKLTLALYLSAILGTVSYNLVVKYFALSKTLFTAVISSLPVFFDVKVLNYPDIYLLVPASTILFLMGRELLMDITDIAGDKYCGITTIPILLGRGTATVLGFFFQMLSAVLLIPIAWYIPLVINTICLIGIFFSIVFALFLWGYKAGNYQRKIVLGLWLPLAFGVVMLLN